MASMTQKIQLRGKSLIIFTRHSSPYWQCRIKLDGEPAFDTSLKVTTQEEATIRAQDLYGAALHKLKSGQPLRSKPFKQIATQFLSWMKDRAERGEITQGSYTAAKSKFNRYYIPYFGSTYVDEIRENEIEAFQEWRKAYWTTGPGATTDSITYERLNPRRGRIERIKRFHKATHLPANSTLRHETTDLRLFFKQAAAWGYIEKRNIPEIKAPPNVSNRRPNFTRKEYRHLAVTAYERMKLEKHPRVKYDKMMLYYWVEILAHTGMRIGEARNLKWKDIRTHETDDGGQVIQMWVSGKGKKRELIAMPETKIFLEYLKSYSGHTKPDDYVFVRQDGMPILRFTNGFNTLLKAANLTLDNYGDKRTPYSLRHSYATFALIEGRVSVYTLAVNMGTSVEMIEKYYGHVKPLQAYKELTTRHKL